MKKIIALLVTLNFESQYLKNNTEISVILPDRPRNVDAKNFYSPQRKYPVLWLLHGTFGDHTDWLRHTNIELYACENNLIVVMPSALNSDYVNWNGFATGFRMWDFFTEELMPLVYAWFPASDKREDNFISGLSMGGYGAVMLAVNHPDKFAAVASLSAAPNDPERIGMPVSGNFEGSDLGLRQKNAIANAGGLEAYRNSNQNTWRIISREYSSGALPKMYFAIGREDFLYPSFERFRNHCRENGMTDIVFDEYGGYTHEWRFWDMTIQKAIRFFGFGEQPDDRVS